MKVFRENLRILKNELHNCESCIWDYRTPVTITHIDDMYYKLCVGGAQYQIHGIEHSPHITTITFTNTPSKIIIAW